MAPVTGDDQQYAGGHQSRTGNDGSESLHAQRWNLRCDQPHTGNHNEQKTYLGQLYPRC